MSALSETILGVRRGFRHSMQQKTRTRSMRCRCPLPAALVFLVSLSSHCPEKGATAECPPLPLHSAPSPHRTTTRFGFELPACLVTLFSNDSAGRATSKTNRHIQLATVLGFAPLVFFWPLFEIFDGPVREATSHIGKKTRQGRRKQRCTTRQRRFGRGRVCREKRQGIGRQRNANHAPRVLFLSTNHTLVIDF